VTSFSQNIYIVVSLLDFSFDLMFLSSFYGVLFYRNHVGICIVYTFCEKASLFSQFPMKQASGTASLRALYSFFRIAVSSFTSSSCDLLSVVNACLSLAFSDSS